MKGIIKKTEPPEFLAWKAQANEDWQPTFDKLQNPEKKILRTSLVKEQGFICAYCCDAIEDTTSIVIEHFEPQRGKEGNQKLSIDYNNLFACCSGIKTDKETNAQIRCCDEIKEDKFSTENGIMPIKPTDTDGNGFICEQAFVYASIGAIIAKNTAYKEQAQHTLTLLNLNNSELKRQRKETCAFLFDSEDNFFDFSLEDVEKFKKEFTLLDGDNKFKPFCNVVMYFLSTYY